MGREQDVLSLLKPQPGMDVGALDIGQVLVQHLRHGGAGDIGPLLGKAGVRQIPAGMLGVGHVHIGDDVHDPAVGLLRQALVLAAVARLHVEDGNVQPLGPDDGQAAVGIPQHQHRIGLGGHHEFVGLGNDIAHGFSQVRAYGVEVDLRVVQAQVVEEDTVQIVVVVLPGVGQDHVKIPAGLVDDRRQTDDFGPGTHNDQEL